MTTRKRSLAQILIVIAAWSLLSTAVAAKEDEFKLLVQHLEAHYHAKRTRIPLLGLANLVVKIVRPKGVKGFKLAVFEEHDFSPRPGEADFDAVMRRALSAQWQPLVRVHSRRDGERTYIYAREDGKDIKLLIVNLEQSEATVLEAKFNPRTLIKYLEKPNKMGKSWETAAVETKPGRVARSAEE